MGVKTSRFGFVGANWGLDRCRVAPSRSVSPGITMTCLHRRCCDDGSLSIRLFSYVFFVCGNRHCRRRLPCSLDFLVAQSLAVCESLYQEKERMFNSLCSRQTCVTQPFSTLGVPTLALLFQFCPRWGSIFIATQVYIWIPQHISSLV